MNKPTIVEPGWSYEKAMVASHYGAEEVYVGVPFTSLRMRQNKIYNFDDLKKTVDDLHKNWSKALLTMNIFPRNTDIKIFEDTVKQIADVGADAIIFSDPGTFQIIRKHLPDTPLHLSTQSSTMNWAAAKFRYDLWIKRIVFARELSLEEIKEIKEKVPGIEIEIFVHGAMCMSYSWRCLLGDYMSGRPGNKWECSHACRFKYKVRLEEERRPGKLFQMEWDENWSHILSSKDLCTINKLQEIIPYVDAIKIEGRSKSEFYVGAVVKAYKHVRDAIIEKKEIDKNIANLVNVIPHREYRDGFLFNGLADFPEWEVRISDDKQQTISDNINKIWTNNKITFDIIWAAMKAHNQLWPALLEKVYKKWLKYELQKLWYKVHEETKVEYKIDDEIVGKWYVDLIVNDSIAIELKSTKLTKWDYYKQLRSYMQNNPKIETWLLLNFYNKSLDYKRLDKWFWDPNRLKSSVKNPLTSTTLDSAGPLFNRNYFGMFSDQFIEKDAKKYFHIQPKEVITPGMKIKFLSPTEMSELEIVEILNSKGNPVEKAHCNSWEVYILTNKKLKGWEILYE